MKRQLLITLWGLLLLSRPGLAPATTLSLQVTDQSSTALVDAAVYAMPVNSKAPMSAPKPVAIEQVGKQFIPFVSVIQVGTPVKFPNHDTIRHHVYSFSAPKIFELKLYSGVPAEPIVFDKPGLVILGCNIHDKMLAYVLAVDTPWFSKTDASGAAHLVDIPSGTYDIYVWHYRQADPNGAVIRGVKVPTGSILDVAIELKPKN